MPRQKSSRVLLTILVVLVLAGGALAGWWGWSTRAQGTPQAVEFADAQLPAELTGARVLGLGEATHGTAEFQQLRQQLTEKAVQQGFRTLVLEEDFGSVHRVDEFVAGGPGTATDAALRFGFAINQTRQVADWLQWLRDHNATVPPGQRIRLVGMDVQRVDANKQIALGYLTGQQPDLAAELSEALRPLDDGHRGPAGMAEPTSRLQRAVQATPVEQPGREDALAAASTLVDGWLLQQAGDYQGTRDRMMFANLERIVEEAAGRGERVLLFGHDGHLAKQPAGALRVTVGQLAAQRWGSGYRVIGTDFVRVRFLSGRGSERSEFALHNRTPLRGLYADTRVGFLAVSQTDGANRHLLETPVAMGSVGEAYQVWMGWVPSMTTITAAPAKLYDAVILVADGTPVTPLG